MLSNLQTHLGAEYEYKKLSGPLRPLTPDGMFIHSFFFILLEMNLVEEIIYDAEKKNVFRDKNEKGGNTSLFSILKSYESVLKKYRIQPTTDSFYYRYLIKLSLKNKESWTAAFLDERVKNANMLLANKFYSKNILAKCFVSWLSCLLTSKRQSSSSRQRIYTKAKELKRKQGLQTISNFSNIPSRLRKSQKGTLRKSKERGLRKSTKSATTKYTGSRKEGKENQDYLNRYSKDTKLETTRTISSPPKPMASEQNFTFAAKEKALENTNSILTVSTFQIDNTKPSLGSITLTEPSTQSQQVQTSDSTRFQYPRGSSPPHTDPNTETLPHTQTQTQTQTQAEKMRLKAAHRNTHTHTHTHTMDASTAPHSHVPSYPSARFKTEANMPSYHSHLLSSHHNHLNPSTDFKNSLSSLSSSSSSRLQTYHPTTNTNLILTNNNQDLQIISSIINHDQPSLSKTNLLTADDFMIKIKYLNKWKRFHAQYRIQR